MSSDALARSRRIAASLLVAAACIGGLTAAAAVRRENGYPPRLPEGRGKSIAEQRCVICHTPMLIVQQHKDATGWEKTIAQMEKWSAPIPPSDREALRGYLLGHFGPREAAGRAVPKPKTSPR
jgi:hypothetical protein